MIEFSSDRIWDERIKSLVVQNMQKLGDLYRVLHDFAFDKRTLMHILKALL